MKRTWIVGLVVVVVCAVPTAAAPAEADSFDGSCRWRGVVEFTPALSFQARPATGHAAAEGVCTGTLRAGTQTTRVDRAPSTYVADNAGRMSCLGGTARGHGHVDVAGTRLEFDLAETRIGPISILRLNGPGLIGTAYVEPQAGVDAVAKCTAGGLVRVPVSIIVSARPLG